MAENTSIGSISISLDIEASSSVEKQINKISNDVADKLKSSIENSTKLDNYSSSLSKSFGKVSKTTSSITSKLGKSVIEGIKKSTKQAESIIDNFQQKISTRKTTRLDNDRNNDASISSSVMKSPKGVTKNDLIVQKENQINLQMNLNNQIEAYKQKLKQIANMQINGNVTEEMLKLDQQIIKLTSNSDKLTVDIRNLDEVINSFDVENASQQINKLSDKKSKLQVIMDRLNGTFKRNSNEINKMSSSVKKTQRPLIDMRSITRSLVRNFVGLQLMITLVGQGVRKLATNFWASLKTNDQFSKSLQQVKSNLSTAFQPIFNAIIPAINSLMVSLSRITAVIATFTSTIFGTTVKAANASAKAMAKAKESVQGYGNALKETQKITAGFDQLNDITETSGGGSQSNGSQNEILNVQVDPTVMTWTEKLKNSLSDIFKNIDSSNLISSLDTLKQKISDLGGKVWSGIEWGLANVLSPLSKWTVEKALPLFLDTLSSTLSLVNQVIEESKPMLSWLWNNLLKPLSEFVGDAVIWTLEQINGALNTLSKNETWLKSMSFWTLAIAAAFIAVKLAVLAVPLAIAAIITIIATLINNWDKIMINLSESWNNTWNSINAFFIGIWEGIKKYFSNLIGAIVQQWRDNISIISKAFEVSRDAIMNVWKGITAWFSNTIIIPISNAFSGMWNALKNGASTAWIGVKSVFSSVASFFKNTFTTAWNAVKNVFSTGGKIFTGIKDGIVSAFTSVVNTVISGINRVVAIPFNGINNSLSKLRDISIIGAKPFKWLPSISVPKIPHLASGGILKEPTLNVAGEYPGARSNPEIVSPQSIMAETFRSVLREFVQAMSNNQSVSMPTIEIILNLGGIKLLDTIIELSKEYQKQTGKVILNV